MFDQALLSQLTSLLQVLLVDITLAGDNAVVVGLAVAGLPTHQKRPAILVGIGAATLLRIGLGAVTLQILAIVGLLLAGGLLLLWVAYKMFRELQNRHQTHRAPAVKTMRQAMLQIVLADLSMSLDNVLAVAGAANGHTWVLVVGLGFSVVLMGVAASYIARLLEKHRWIAWVGLVLVLYIAGKLIWQGGQDVFGHIS